jgi:hypothetical protein
MAQLLLYSTSGCHLCEQAQEVIRRALGLPVDEVDIALDETLMARYGVRIPVLRRVDTGAEIGWPFGEEEVRVLVE